MAASMPPDAAGPSRVVHHAEAIDWLGRQGRLVAASVVTSLPDRSELPHLGLPGWRRWFEDAAALVMNSVCDDGVAIFFQSDVKHDGWWIDKGALVGRAAERAGMGLLFHRIVCRRPAGTLTFGRASYSHLLGFARTPRPSPRHPAADVLPDAGFVPGRKAMGVKACLDACRYVCSATTTRIVVDPFCGWGTVLAVANALGLDAVGVDHSARQCRRARALTIDIEAHGAGGGSGVGLAQRQLGDEGGDDGR
jgi:hypothetical protein